MQISHKTIYAFLCVLMLFLFPFVYADESVNVSFYQDGQKVEEVSTGETVTLHAELVSANSSDSVQFVLQDESLAFTDNPKVNKLNVYGRYENNLWIYETKVKVLEDNPTLPTGTIVRDSTQPNLSDSEKPQSISIALNTEQIIAPGDTIQAYAILEPVETVNSNYFNYVDWTVSYGDQEVELSNPTGESITFTVPEDAANTSINVSAILKGTECGLGQDLEAKTASLKVKDDSLSVQIFPSVESDGVLIGKYVGFSSEILRNGKVAESGISENSEYTWTAKIGDEFVNGKKDGRTNYAVCPNQVGTLSVYLTVTLENGITLESQIITKTVVEEIRNLESVNIRKIENGDITTSDEIEITKDLEPQYVTNIDQATYHWIAKQDEVVIAESDKADNFVFKPKSENPVTVTLEVTPKDSEESIVSEPLVININQESEQSQNSSSEKDNSNDTEPENKTPSTEQDSEETKILSGIIKTDRTTTGPLVVGEQVNLSANLATQGSLDNIVYQWQAIDSNGQTIATSDQLKNFNLKVDDPGEVKVTFTAQVNNPTSSVEEKFKKIELTETLNFVSQEQSAVVNDTANKNNGIPSESKITTNQSEQIENSNKPQNDKQITAQNETENKEVSGNDEKVSLTQENKANLNESLGSGTDTNSGNEITGSEQDSSKDKEVKSEEESGLEKSEAVLSTVEQPTTSSSGNDSNEISTVTYANPNNSDLTSQGIKKIVGTGTTYTIPATTSSSPVQSSSVLNRSSNIENPKTGVDFSIGQVAVLTVCSVLILSSVIILIRKSVQ